MTIPGFDPGTSCYLLRQNNKLSSPPRASVHLELESIPACDEVFVGALPSELNGLQVVKPNRW